MKNTIVPLLRQQFAQCVFNHKVYEVATERYEKYLFIINILNIVLVSFALIFLIFQISTWKQLYSNIAWWITIWEIIFLFIQLYLNLWDKVVNYKNTALKYMWLRDEYKNLLWDSIDEDLNNDRIIMIRDHLQTRYQTISELWFTTTRNDYIEAQRRLKTSGKDNEDFTWSDKEINKFLPKELRK